MAVNPEVAKWLANWVEENLQVPQYVDDKSEMADDVATCRQSAEIDGISAKDLNAAASGDLERYLFNAQNAFTDTQMRKAKR
jgi:hypothetical protein